MRRLLATLSAGVLLLTGCDVYSLPLPGGANTGRDPMQLTVEFRDVLDLVPHSSVKVNDVSVGKVTEIETAENGEPGNYIARVTVEVPNDTELPTDTRAHIRQTSLLGEKFVSLEATQGGTGALADGDVIPLERTGRNTEIEEVFGALSLLLNGGGVAQMKTIAEELNNALDGREDSARSLLRQIEQLMGQLDTNKADVVRALEALNRLSLRAREHMDSIDAAMDELPSALRSIDRQRDDLVRMLRALNRLSDVGVRVIDTTKQSTVRALRSLRPVLMSLADSGDALVNSFHTLIAYPFPDEAFGTSPQVARNLHIGDYINLNMDLRLNFAEGVGLPCTFHEFDESPLGAWCLELRDVLNQCNASGPGCLDALRGLLDRLPDLLTGLSPNSTGDRGDNSDRPGGNRGNRGGNPVPDLLGDTGGLLGGNRDQGSPSGGGLSDLIGGLFGSRNRPGFSTRSFSPAELSGVEGMGTYYDPALVGLLATPLAVRQR